MPNVIKPVYVCASLRCPGKLRDHFYVLVICYGKFIYSSVQSMSIFLITKYHQINLLIHVLNDRIMKSNKLC